MPIDPILAKYPAEYMPQQVVDLGGAGGYSGARFWRIQTPAGTFCLRRWPQEHPDPIGLAQIHGVLKHVAQAGIDFVPAPRVARDGATFVVCSGHLWELSPWLPGAPHRDCPAQAEHVRAALMALARFHVAAATMPHGGSASAAPSPGIARRFERLRAFTPDRLLRLAAAVERGVWPAGADIAREILIRIPLAQAQVERELVAVAGCPVPQMPCLRDIHREHVLFQAGQVTGLIDFGALRQESPAGDIARLLGSYAADDRDLWEIGLAAYSQIREHPPDELRMVRVFDRSGVLLGGLNWIEWIYEQQRQFERMEEIAARLQGIAARLRHVGNH